jgi:hypothetical protein
VAREQVSFRFAPGMHQVGIRELTGHDERFVCDTSTSTAIGLIDRVVDTSGGAPWRSAAELTASDRDRLLAAIYRLTYGARVESTSRCIGCGSQFDLSFSLDDLMAAVQRAPTAGAAEELPDGTFRSGDGVRFRLPTGRDELAVAALPASEAARALLDRSVIEGPPASDALVAVEELIEEVAPVVALDLDTRCPECGGAQAVRFDMQYYLLRLLEQERSRTAREIHRIAQSYGWSLDETLGLRRSERRLFVMLIEAELSQTRRSR